MEKVSKKKGKEEKPDARGKFSGRIGYVLAVAGSAVGLGNIWRFPYLAAKYGGGMFLLVYLILMLTFGYVMIMKFGDTGKGRIFYRVYYFFRESGIMVSCICGACICSYSGRGEKWS